MNVDKFMPDELFARSLKIACDMRGEGGGWKCIKNNDKTNFQRIKSIFIVACRLK